jgi:hypothetical protein
MAASTEENKVAREKGRGIRSGRGGRRKNTFV